LGFQDPSLFLLIREKYSSESATFSPVGALRIPRAGVVPRAVESLKYAVDSGAYGGLPKLLEAACHACLVGAEWKKFSIFYGMTQKIFAAPADTRFKFACNCM
jgi:hypothetical protein